jgi:hypothetical protein
MKDYGIDGAMFQRFAVGLGNGKGSEAMDVVLRHCVEAADAEGRSLTLMYDFSGLKPAKFASVVEDWKKLSASGLTRHPCYQHHGGKPLVSLWGIGFKDRPAAFEEWTVVLRDLKASGVKPRAYAHITGGGLPENLERLFRGMGADLEIPKWEMPGAEKLFAHVDAEDRFHTFNMGIGWVAIVSESEVETALKAGPGGTVIGRMVDAEGVRVKVRGE